MGIGTLRRYHSRPDTEVGSETTSPQDGQEEPTELEKAKAELDRLTAVESELTAKVAAHESSETPSLTDQELAELQAACGNAYNAVQEAKAKLEAEEAAELQRAQTEIDGATGEAQTGEVEGEGEGEGSNPSGTSQPAKPNGNGSRELWVEYALSPAGGKTSEELQGLKRDQIAALFTD